MATKKKASSKKKVTGKSAQDKNLLQTDDPIIIKPGGSITVEFDRKFGSVTSPSALRRRRRHNIANALTKVRIYRNNVPTDYALNPGDYVVICYDSCRRVGDCA
jgi:hypothetical protein